MTLSTVNHVTVLGLVGGDSIYRSWMSSVLHPLAGYTAQKPLLASQVQAVGVPIHGVPRASYVVSDGARETAAPLAAARRRTTMMDDAPSSIDRQEAVDEDDDKLLTEHHVTLLPPHLLRETPSQRDGIARDEEDEHRRWACGLAQEAGILLKLPQQVMCTAQNLLHRFYYRKSLKSHDAFVAAMGCLFLASKVEEKPKRLREVLFAFHYVYKVRTNATGKMELGGAMYAGWKESLVTVERTILKELGFSFYVIEHAHRFILFFVKLLDGDAALAQEAWAYCNDALRTDLQLRSRAEVIACAAVRLAAAKLRRTLPSLEKDGVDWWAAFGVDGGELERAAAEITALYAARPLGWLPSLAPGPRLTDPAFAAAVLNCVEIKILRRVRAEPSRRPPRHRRDACSMTWRCRFVTARRSQHGRVIAEK